MLGKHNFWSEYSIKFHKQVTPGKGGQRKCRTSLRAGAFLSVTALKGDSPTLQTSSASQGKR